MKIKKIAVLGLVLSVLFLNISFTIPAQAQTFVERKPSFGLYCENQTANIHGNVKYVIDENGQAVQYSKYTINAKNENVTLYIPFIANAFTIPQIDIDTEGEICYGERYSIFTNELSYDFYTADINEMIGTIYTLTSSSESFKIDFTMLENQNYIYRLPQDYHIAREGRHLKYTTNNASPEIPYEIFIINGDCSEFTCTAETTKETVTVKEYIDRNLNEFEEYFAPLGIAKLDILYALINQALAKNINYEFFDFFLDSYTQQRLIAYKFNAQPSCNIEYSMPVYVQKNSGFTPEIFMTEVTATGNYNIDYSIELNSSLPFIIESSADVKKLTDTLYTVENVNSDFYFVFSASEKPQSIYGDNNRIETWQIVLFVLLGVAACFFIVSSTIMIVSVVKNRKQRKGNK